ncbi:MAG: amidohydrolase family protein [Rhizobiales bacterium]|nr:amidohydrolase family protein [Hyphomicrobiales bacterium]
MQTRPQGGPVNTTRTIDVHAHILAEDTIELWRKEAPKTAPRLTEIDADFGVLEVAGVPYRPFPRGGWDLERRLKDMDAAEVDVQVLSNTPQTFLYNLDASQTADASALQNDQIAKLVKERPDRFMGMATLPMQNPERAVAELRRAVRDLGLVGAQIGTHIEGKNLDDPGLAAFWAAVAELDAFIMIHPTKPAGGDRNKAYYLTNLIGNPLETTIAAASLAFGGVMERHPDLKILLVHGGGYVPYQYGRWTHGWEVRGEPKQFLKIDPEASVRRFYYDTITHGKPALEYLVSLMGASRVVLGSDYPYDMGNWELVREARALPIPEADRACILGGNAEALFRK